MSKPLSLQVKLGDVIITREALIELANAKVSARMGYTISLLLSALEPHFKAWDTAYAGLFQKYGEPIPDSANGRRISPSKEADYRKELGELRETTLVLSGVGKIKMSALVDEGVKLSGAEINALAWFVKDDAPDALFAEED